MEKLLLLIIALAAFGACEDKDRPTPTPNPIPYINKFNCKINGKYWEVIPKELLLRPNQSNTLMVDFYTIKEDTTLRIWADNQKTAESLVLSIPISANGNIFQNTHPNPFINYGGMSQCEIYTIDSTKINIVKITNKDFSKRIMKGEFEFTVIEKSCKDTLIFTEGYFDVKY